MGKRDWIPPNLDEKLPNRFKHGICDCCFDFSNCLKTIFCTACVVGCVADKLDHNGCCCACLSTNPCFIWNLRQRLR